MSYRRVAWTLVIALSVGASHADDPEPLTPKPRNLTSTTCGEGWIRWEVIQDIAADQIVLGSGLRPERITALTAYGKDVWVGTSHGRLLARQGDSWIFQGQLRGIQITGIAPENVDKVWVSTSDGIRRLDREKDQTWQVREFRTYYEGHPAFVSGAYIPGEDAVRLWGYVDDICIPEKNQTYAPFVISTEHGLFCSSRGYVWHHFMPHYWGANSPWLDTRELVPHRRPTCILEDGEGNLWIGSQWDGLIRLNAHAREYHTRKPENNEKDGTEFSFIGSEELGFEFDRVVNLATSAHGGIWAILASAEAGSCLARFDGTQWQTLVLEKNINPLCVAETERGVTLVGAYGSVQRYGRDGQGIWKVMWDSSRVERLDSPHDPRGRHYAIQDMIVADGTLWAASPLCLFENDPDPKPEPSPPQ